ncbi:hypothetical protein MXM33_00225 [Acinetobacter vivianii]|uniref:hypothetical protein n=1 Tax=Acinetobacter vivianii TaxID=1776742 RepID=UPI002DB5CFBB|nr:hypothetical protein [Acinetobacter vivianii]MEB6665452.1 hypothetical protein [Acinetobacter vivianii]
MQIKFITVGLMACVVMNSAYAIDAKYREQLERSGCTQLSEAQGCDIHKTAEENMKAGSTASDAVAVPENGVNQPQWIAERSDGTTLATIRIDQQQRVWVNDTRVAATQKNGQFEFRQGKINYTIFTDLEKQPQSFWSDRYSTDKGKIVFR